MTIDLIVRNAKSKPEMLGASPRYTYTTQYKRESFNSKANMGRVSRSLREKISQC